MSMNKAMWFSLFNYLDSSSLAPYPLEQGWQSFSGKSQFFNFVGHKISFSVTQLCFGNVKAVDNREMNEHVAQVLFILLLVLIHDAQKLALSG